MKAEAFFLAKSISIESLSKQEKVYLAFVALHPGATNEEIESKTELDHPTVLTAGSNLIDLGLIVRSGKGVKRSPFRHSVVSGSNGLDSVALPHIRLVGRSADSVAPTPPLGVGLQQPNPPENMPKSSRKTDVRDSKGKRMDREFDSVLNFLSGRERQ